MCFLLAFKYCHSKFYPNSDLNPKKISRAAWAQFFITTLSICITLSFILMTLKEPINNLIDDLPQEKLTVRVNTFRRLDLLEIFLDHYSTCTDTVNEIQIVWSDQLNAAPIEWEKSYLPLKVKFEIHGTNSLSNRFKVLTNVSTSAVLSIDDDLVIPCKDLKSAMGVWLSNRKALVGFSPRIVSYDIETGHAKYGRWQHTWWNGAYSLMLTKVCLLHKVYLKNYVDLVPKSVLDYIDNNRNCEDLAMAHLISQLTSIPPVWISGTIYETGIISGGISSGSSHFSARGICLEMLKSELSPVINKISDMTTGSMNAWPWIVSEQRAVPIGMGAGDIWGLQDFLTLMWK